MPVDQTFADLTTINNLGPNTTFPNASPRDFFSYCVEDVISMLAKNMSPLMRWIPSKSTTVYNRTVAHLSFVVGEDFDGSESYLEYITVEDPIGLCDFGNGGVDFNICEYQHQVKRVSLSNKDKPLHYFSEGGIQYCETEPRTIVRGELNGMDITNDVAWLLSGLTFRLQSHLEWNKIHGMDALVSDPGSYGGLREILSVGWVKNHSNGEGSCVWTDPFVMTGADLDTPEDLYKRMRFGARKVIWRMRQRGYQPTTNDMCVTGPMVFAQMIWDWLATGALAGLSGQTVVDFVISPEVWQRERDRLARAGFGFGVFPIDNLDIPFIPEDHLGLYTTDNDDEPAVVGTMMILTRYYDGRTILLHEWLNLAAVKPAKALEGTYQIQQGGMIRMVWNEVNGTCYWYGIEMWARFVSLIQPLQVVINDVTLATNGEYDIESSDWTHGNFYAYEGELGGQGEVLLVPLIA